MYEVRNLVTKVQSDQSCTITSQSYSDLLKCDFVKNLYILCHLIKEILVRYFLANFLKRCVLLRLLQKSCKELGKILLIGLIKIWSNSRIPRKKIEASLEATRATRTCCIAIYRNTCYTYNMLPVSTILSTRLRVLRVKFKSRTRS